MDQISILRIMLQARESDRREAILFRQGKSWMQISSRGHEALLVVACQLTNSDMLVPYYRSRHMFLAKGASQYDLACDFFAKEKSSSSGRSVSVHFSSPDLGIFPGLAPTASHCPAAAGLAWAQKLRGHGAVTLCTIGDGATREGAFYESVAFAVQEQLPLIFLVEDNGYAISTPTAKMSPFRLGVFHDDIFRRFDGRSVDTVLSVSGTAIEKARSGNGPTILWAEVDRIDPHTVIEDQKKYRDAEALSRLVDPVELYARDLLYRNVICDQDWQLMQDEAKAGVRDAYASAQKEALASPRGILEQLYASRSPVYADLPDRRLADRKTRITMVEAINQTLASALSTFANVVLFGQDIEDPKGGVFGLTAGLSAKFPGRVVNAPVAEVTIVGAAVGLAAMGFKPVFEIQFIDFLAPAFDQLANQVASLRWRTSGNWTCPMVLYAPYGAYLPAGGLWHSQSNDGWWTHIPGLRVAVPSTPEDAVGLFWAAVQDDDPSLILIPKHILQKALPDRIDDGRTRAIEFGKASVVESGTDVTLVAWGNCVELATEASAIVKHERGISCEVLDLRTLIPWDCGAVRASLRRTGRIVVIQEDSATSSFGATVIAELVSNPDAFAYLISSPRLVSRCDVHIPYHPELEQAVLPSVNDVLDAIAATLEH